ncbi:hypothetical protein [Jannaschia marina]|uniref:hypothetical protein n=1 Tax=Jannaschia marina TaxID=2741674 RepID=UPI0015CA308D|nr:hypothetical protein [Jannaschia marina]
MSNPLLPAAALLLALAGPALADGHAGVETMPPEVPIIVQALPTAGDFDPGASDPDAADLMDALTGRWEDLPGADAVQGYVPSGETMAALDTLHRATYEHRTRALDHRHAVFAWQHVSSQVLFVIVILIVGIGLYFSWIQFRAERDGSPAKSTTLKAGKSGIEVTSPVLGVIILALSLGFFYLYLNHVYPISEL